MLTKINKWFIALPESAQHYFLNLLILNLSFLDVIPLDVKTKEKGKFLMNYLDEVNLSTAEELKRFLLAYSTIDIIIQAKRDHDFESEQVRAFKILNLANEVKRPSRNEQIIEKYASGAEEQMWREVILSWDNFKKAEEMSLLNIIGQIVE